MQLRRDHGLDKHFVEPKLSMFVVPKRWVLQSLGGCVDMCYDRVAGAGEGGRFGMFVFHVH